MEKNIIKSTTIVGIRKDNLVVIAGDGQASLGNTVMKSNVKKIGEMDTELFHEFFKAFSNESKCNLHIENLYGKNNHHIIESCFKAFAKSLRFAIEIDNRRKDNIPSSKGTL